MAACVDGKNTTTADEEIHDNLDSALEEVAADEAREALRARVSQYRLPAEAAKVFGVATAFRLNYRSLKLVQVLDRASRLSAAAAAAEAGAGAPAAVTGASEEEPRNK